MGFCNAYDRRIGGPLGADGARGLLPSQSVRCCRAADPSSFKVARACERSGKPRLVVAAGRMASDPRLIFSLHAVSLVRVVGFQITCGF
jgi:hypothetical protein